MKRVQEISECHKDMQNVTSQIHLLLHPLNVLQCIYMDFYLVLVAPSSSMHIAPACVFVGVLNEDFIGKRAGFKM